MIDNTRIAIRNSCWQGAKLELGATVTDGPHAWAASSQAASPVAVFCSDIDTLRDARPQLAAESDGQCSEALQGCCTR